MSYLKTDKVLIQSIDETVEIIELNALGQREMIKAHGEGDMFAAAAQVVKHGTKKWAGKPVEDIMTELPLHAIQEIAECVTALSGDLDTEVGKSEPSGDFSTS